MNPLADQLLEIGVDPKAIPPFRTAEVVGNHPLIVRLGGDPTGDDDVFDVAHPVDGQPPVGGHALLAQWSKSIVALAALNGGMAQRTWSYLRTASPMGGTIWYGSDLPLDTSVDGDLWWDLNGTDLDPGEWFIGPDVPPPDAPDGSVWWDTWDATAGRIETPSRTDALPDVATVGKARTLSPVGGNVWVSPDPVPEWMDPISTIHVDMTGAASAESGLGEWRYLDLRATSGERREEFGLSVFPTTFAAAYWRYPTLAGGYHSTETRIQVQTDGSPDGYFFAHQGWLEGETPNHPLYAGLQTNGIAGGVRVGKMAIFSVWDTTLIAVSSGWAESFSHEGSGRSVKILYPWVVGHEYGVRITGVQKSADVIEWTGVIEDYSGGLGVRTIGTIETPTSFGWLAEDTVTFHERYLGEPRMADLIPSTVLFHQPIAGLVDSSFSYINEADVPLFNEHFHYIRFPADATLVSYIGDPPWE